MRRGEGVNMIDNEITERILRGAFKVHSELGPGLLESSYKLASLMK
jgi:hypothetical protein